MKSLFEAIVIIVVFTVIFLLYYLLKEWLDHYKSSRKSRYFSNIIRAEKRAHNKRSLRVVLAKLKINQIFWVEIYVRNREGERLRLEHQPGKHYFYLLFENLLLDSQIKLNLEKFGDLIIGGKNKIYGIKSEDTEQLLNGVFYYFEHVTRINEDEEIIIRY